jgi:hypothetical protein
MGKTTKDFRRKHQIITTRIYSTVGKFVWRNDLEKIFLLACFEYKLEFTGEQWEVTFSC